MRLRFVIACCATTAALTAPAVGWGQDYILRPGPRGFDSSLNRYGTTEDPTMPRGVGDRFSPSRTNIKIELLMPGDGAALDAQRWSKTFAEIGYPALFRRPILDDRAEISETTRGPLRFVTVVGSLDNRGNLAFPGRSFSPGDAAELKEWLDELKTYGAQGSPEGRPLWGLSRTQFEVVYEALAKPVEGDVSGLPLADALARLPLPKEYPLRFSVAAKEALDVPGQQGHVSRSIAGLTAGTALAFVLNEFGLAFRPERMPDGKIELAIAPRPATGSRDDDAASVVWPIGWEVESRSTPEPRGRPVKDEDAVPPNRVQIAPGLFQQRQAIGLSDVSLAAAFAIVETEAGVTVLLDRPGLNVAGVDVAKSRVTTPPQNTSWNVVLRSITFRNRLRHEIRHDEAGHPIVWVTPLRLGR